MTTPVHAFEEIRRQSVDLIDERKIDPHAHPKAAREIVELVIGRYQREAALGHERPLSDSDEMTGRVLASVTRFGPLTDLLSRDDIEEVFIEGARVTYIESDGRLRGLPFPTTESENRRVVDRLVAESDRHLDVASPIVQARVLNGTARLTAVIPPISDQLSATIRRYALRRESLEALTELDSLSAAAATFLGGAIESGCNIVISGPPGAGKTSMLAALMAAVPPDHCVRCCEEVRELHVPLLHGSYYEAKPPGLDGSGEIPLRSLVKMVLAMRPDRIVVGEVRGAEAFELTRAVNAGCGFMCTVHANSGPDALVALVNAALMAGENVAEPIVRRVFASSIDLVVHLDRDSAVSEDRRLRRQVLEIVALSPSLHDDFTTEPLFERERLGTDLVWTGSMPPSRIVGKIDRVVGDGFTRQALEAA